MQQPQQIILPAQVTKALLHHLGKQVVLEVLQREDVFPFGKKEKMMSVMMSFSDVLPSRVSLFGN